MNDWSRIRAHYRALLPQILAEERCEWGIDPYAWDNGMMEMTPIERWLWADIRDCNSIFYPQFPVGGVFVDFANPRALVAIECDGAAYHLDKEKDAARDARLATLGWRVYRITGSDCRKEFDEETMTPSPANVFVRRISEDHRLSRHHRTRPFESLSFGRFASA